MKYSWQKMQAPFLRPSMVDALMISSISGTLNPFSPSAILRPRHLNCLSETGQPSSIQCPRFPRVSKMPHNVLKNPKISRRPGQQFNRDRAVCSVDDTLNPKRSREMNSLVKDSKRFREKSDRRYQVGETEVAFAQWAARHYQRWALIFIFYSVAISTDILTHSSSFFTHSLDEDNEMARSI